MNYLDLILLMFVVLLVLYILYRERAHTSAILDIAGIKPAAWRAKADKLLAELVPDLKGDAGPQGPKGDQGEPGPQGEPGQPAAAQVFTPPAASVTLAPPAA